MNIFLRAKHWQLFLVTFGLPMLIQIIMMANIFSTVFKNSNEPTPAILNNFVYLPIIMVVFMAGLFGWIWSVGTGLQKFIPEQLKLRVTKFKAFFFIPVIYIVLFSLFMMYIFSSLAQTGEPTPFFFGSVMLIFPLHLFSMFCIFYCLYFTAKTLKTIELQRPASISDYLGEFFLIWFFPIGIWVLQPRINRLMDDNVAA